LEELTVIISSYLDYTKAYQSGKIPNLKTNSMNFPLVSIDLIRDGVYQGKESPYRRNPRDIVEFLNIPHSKQSLIKI
jgi:hypothetical protein